MCGMLELLEGPYAMKYDPERPKDFQWLVRIPGDKRKSVDCLDLNETRDVVGFGSTKMRAVRKALATRRESRT